MNPRVHAARVDGLSAKIVARLNAVSDWLRVCAEYCAAARAYEQLARLSDAELARRGLSRATLARDICATFDTTFHQQDSGREDFSWPRRHS